MWDDACIESGQTVIDCNNFKEDSDDNSDRDSDDLGDQNMQDCYDDGYEDGRNNPYDHERGEGCREYQSMYHKGFIEGCISADNTKEICETFTDA
jgi:hypothetical protein